MSIRFLLVLSFSVLISSCGNNSDDVPAQGAAQAAVELPPQSGEIVEISGVMTFWMHEGSAGCYGTLESDSNEIQLWSDADRCGDSDFTENEQATVRIRYSEDNQYGPGTTYTVVTH